MYNKKEINKFLKRIAILVIAVLMLLMMGACKGQKAAEKDEDTKKEEVVYKPNSVLGIAESYIGKDIQGLIESVGKLKEDPHIKPTNDGGGYEGLYEFEGFTVVTYAKSENAKNLVTEIIPDKDSDVYKESLEEKPEGTK